MAAALRLALVLTALFALLLACFRIGDYDPVPALMDCDALCWQGLQVQSTRREQAIDVMTRLTGSAPRFAVCYDQEAGAACELYRWDALDGATTTVEIGRGRLTLLTLDQPASLTLGEMLLALQRLDHPLEAYSFGTARGSLDLQLTFTASNLTLAVVFSCPLSYADFFHTPVAFIGIDAPPSEVYAALPFRIVRQTLYRNCE